MKEQKIIIFEGHDKSGKTTIAKALSEHLDIPVFKAVRNKHWWDPMVNLLYFVEGVTQFLEQSKQSIILDRWVPSDYVYSTLFNRDISFRKIWEIDERLSKLDTTVIVCYKNEDAFIHDTEDELFINESQYQQMTDLYREYAKQSRLKFYFLNTSDEDLAKQINIIIDII
jgi:thymidylate kinase